MVDSFNDGCMLRSCSEVVEWFGGIKTLDKSTQECALVDTINQSESHQTENSLRKFGSKLEYIDIADLEAVYGSENDDDDVNENYFAHKF